MNFIKFLEDISDKQVLETKFSRRGSIGQIKNLGKGLAFASIPFALAATSNKTAAATMAMSSAMLQASPTEVLNFALTLEYLEREFYEKGLDSEVIPSADRDVFGLIYDHEVSHVEFLLIALGAAAVAKPSFDFTAGGTLNPFEDYQTFLALSQGFEDTGVRAYKGQAGALIDNNDLLEYALQIHAVEARHASQVRRMRGEKGWIPFDNPGFPFPAVYDGEENTVQLGINLVQALPSYTRQAITESFDEPLTMAEVNAIASLFIE